MLQNLYKTDSRISKIIYMRNLDNFKQAQSWNSMGYICLKTTFHLKHYLQIYLTLLSRLVVWKMTWRIHGKFSPEHLKVSKLGFWWDPLIQSWKSMSFKIRKGVICHDNKEWRKILRGIELSFQSWHEEFNEFWPEHSKVSKIFTLMGSFWAKYKLFELKKYRGVIFHETEEGYKIWRGINLSFQNWHI